MEIESAKITKVDNLTVSASVLGEIFGVSDRRIRQMAEEGIIIRAAKGRYKFLESVKNYVLSLKLAIDTASQEDVDGGLDIEEEKALHEKVKRHISELKLQTMEGKLHRAEDVEKIMTDMLTNFKTKVMAIPSKTAPMLEEREAGYIKSKLTVEIADVLNELKDYNPKLFYSNEYLENIEDEEDE